MGDEGFTMTNQTIRLGPLLILMLLSATVTAASHSIESKLTEDERAWLKENPLVRFTGDPNWLPYEAFDSHGNYKGIVSEHLDLIASMTGLNNCAEISITWGTRAAFSDQIG